MDSNFCQSLEKLASECISIGDELTLRLNKLKVDPQHKSKWRTFRQVLKAMWQEDKISSTYKRLENIRNQLAFRLTVMTKENQDALSLSQNAQFDALDQQTALILRKLAQNPAEVISSLNAQTTELRRRHDESDVLAQKLQKETLAAINRLQPPASSSRAFSPRTPSPKGQRQVEIKPEDVISMLLNMLKFRQMTARQEDIATAHTGTFRWLLDESTRNPSFSLFSPLLPWLETEQGCYWVSGKAGSGKSTCMKYLGASDPVNIAVAKWAGSVELINATFYFWRGGTRLQRSQEGLLRSLLHSILSQRRDLVQACFPEKFDELQFGVENDSEVIPLSECIKPAFQHLSRMKSGSVKIFLFIDGVDEFDGDHAEISKFFKDLATNPNFKILLSSRPISACVDVFKSCPGLRLQDLTRQDIKRYVEDTIGCHERMDQLLSEDPTEASKLTNLILSKASGVFLWVRLVVKSLLDGFRNYDRISDLKRRVDEYPAELGSLYLHMFQSLEARYQSHAAQLLRIMVQSIAVQEEVSLTVLQMSFADEVSPVQALRAPVREMELKERSAKCNAMEGRLRSRCWGLLEVVHENPASVANSRHFYDSKVQVLHKSVLDFLAEDDVWTTLLSATQKFDPNYALIAASLMQVKTLPTAAEVDRNVKHCLAYCQLLEKSTSRAQTPFIKELNRVVCMRTEASNSQRTSVEWDKPQALPYGLPKSGADGYEMSQRMLLLASEAGLSRYFDVLLRGALHSSSEHCDVSFLIPRLIHIMIDSLKKPGGKFVLSDEYSTLTATFLDYLAKSPNAQANSIGHAWRGTFCSIAQISDEAISWTDDQVHFEILQALLSIVPYFLAHGANVNASNWEQFASWSEAYDGKAPKNSFQNHFMASNVLVNWLDRISDSLTHSSEEYEMLERQIKWLQQEVHSRMADHPEKIKQREWTRWLYSRHAQINAEYSARQHIIADGRKNARVVCEGPVEICSDIVLKPRPTPAPAKDVQKPMPVPSCLYRHEISNSNDSASKMRLENVECVFLPWHRWLATHYYQSCSRNSLHPRSVKVIPGEFELHSVAKTLFFRSKDDGAKHRNTHSVPSFQPLPTGPQPFRPQRRLETTQKKERRFWIFSKKR